MFMVLLSLEPSRECINDPVSPLQVLCFPPTAIII
jgi:hypothetical protein